MDDKNISFLSCIDDNMATLFAQERGLQAQKHLQKTANIAVGREKTCIFCGGKTLRGYF